MTHHRALFPVWARIPVLISERAGALLVVTAALGITFWGIPLFVGRVPNKESIEVSVLFSGFGYAILFASRVVCGDLVSGPSQLWLQKPVRPVPFYLRRFAEALAAATALTAGLALAVRASGALAGWPATGLFIPLQSIFPFFAAACVAFGLSPWLFRGAGLVAAAIVLTGGTMNDNLSVQVDAFGSMTPLVQALMFPLGTGKLSGYLAGETSVFPWGYLVQAIVYSVAWIAIGAAGTWRVTTKKGLIPPFQSN